MFGALKEPLVFKKLYYLDRASQGRSVLQGIFAMEGFAELLTDPFFLIGEFIRVLGKLEMGNDHIVLGWQQFSLKTSDRK